MNSLLVVINSELDIKKTTKIIAIFYLSGTIIDGEPCQLEGSSAIHVILVNRFIMSRPLLDTQREDQIMVRKLTMFKRLESLVLLSYRLLIGSSSLRIIELMVSC